jgi:GAF domain-containing protein
VTIAPAASPAASPEHTSASTQLIESTLRAAAGITGMQFIGVSGIEAQTYTVEKALGAFRGIAEGQSLPLSDTFCVRMLAGATPSTADAAIDPAYADVPIREQYGIRSYFGVPLRQSGVITGTLCGIDSTSVTVSADDLRVLASLARVIDAETARDPQIRLHRTKAGWQVESGDGSVLEAEDATLAMSLADLISAEAGELVPAQRPQRPEGELSEAERLRVQISQLEHALSARVVIEQAIGVVAQRFGLAPREAFDRLRKSARSRGQRVHDLAVSLVLSARDETVSLPNDLR